MMNLVTDNVSKLYRGRIWGLRDFSLELGSGIVGLWRHRAGWAACGWGRERPDQAVGLGLLSALPMVDAALLILGV